MAPPQDKEIESKENDNHKAVEEGRIPDSNLGGLVGENEEVVNIRSIG